MPKNVDRILSLEVPIIVRIGSRKMTLGEVVALIPGMIIELPQRSDDALELLVNNKPIGSGAAVKVGENFGLKISFIGEPRDRIQAMGPSSEVGIDSASDPADELLALAADRLTGR